ncbi:MAG: 3-methyl-2-oxobutanoate hydroxymethyltransferase [Calditerrivibrio sp.]|nr:3-methyl-2-oxobutanoate hydroxymethyltransferase [Calditerrivibrio sp.]
MSKYAEIKKLTVNHLKGMKNVDKIVCLTAYDYTSAKILDEAGVDLILVGDSLGMVVAGYENTLPVTLDQLILHCKYVKNGSKRAFLVADMPFGSYQVSEEEALKNCIRVIKETGFDAVKIEGGVDIASIIRKLNKTGINVMGHIGLMPQLVNTMGGYKIQGRYNEDRLLEDALALEEAGVFAIVLEGIIEKVSQKITERVKVPTIGIGSGRYCDGQILVFHDIFGLYDDKTPKFVKKYLNGRDLFFEATKKYIKETKENIFPAIENVFLE